MTYTYSLITSRLFSKLRFVTLGACSLPTLFPTNQPSFATPKRWLKSLFLPSTVPSQDSQLTLSMLKRCVSQHTQFISSSSDLTDIFIFFTVVRSLPMEGKGRFFSQKRLLVSLNSSILRNWLGKKSIMKGLVFIFIFIFSRADDKLIVILGWEGDGRIL